MRKMPRRCRCSLLVACVLGWMALPGLSRGADPQAVAENREEEASPAERGEEQVPRKRLLVPLAPAAPAYVLVLRSRGSNVVPQRTRDGQTAGGHIDVVHVTPDRVVFWMRGAVVAGAEQWKGGQASMHFTLEQDFEVVPTRAGLHPPRLILDGVLIGALHSTLKAGGTATQGPAAASVVAGRQPILAITLKPHEVHCGQRLFVNDREGPFERVIAPGGYHLSQAFDLAAVQPWNHCQHLGEGAGAFFDPLPHLEPRWWYLVAPFRTVPCRDFGFAVVLRVAEDIPLAAGPAAPDDTERLPAPRPVAPANSSVPAQPGQP
jgi:hypothetical protein